ncbi:hypothetical protein JCM3774_004100 [Rhodotorula dairenensis]
MLTHHQSGFRAALAVRELPSPPLSPAATQDGGASSVPAQNSDVPSGHVSPVPKILVEHARTVLETGQIAAYVEASDESIRVLFHRDRTIQPVAGLEAYAAFLYLPDEQPWCKVFAIGRGVLELPGLDWYIDGDLGPPAPTLAETAQTCATLKIYRCTLKPDAQLGYGYVSSTDVAAVDETSPVCVFAWHFVTKHQLELLVIGAPRIVPHVEDPLGFTIAPVVKPEATLQDELAPALDFLRISNRLLVSLLTADQKSKFLKLLATCPEAQSLLQVEQLCALDRVGFGTVQPNADTSTTSEQASDQSTAAAEEASRTGGSKKTGQKRKVAAAAVSRPRRASTAAPKYHEPSSD